MRKKFEKFCIVLSAFILICCLSSCASIPKKIKQGDTLVIGQAKFQARGFGKEGYGKIDGTTTRGIELTVTDLNTNIEKTIRTGKDGYFFVKGLNAHNPHRISKVKLNSYGNEGNRSLWVEFPDSEVFIPYENLVVNIGCTTYIFDGKSGKVWSECRDHYKMRNVFKEKAQESEWADKKIYDQCGLR